MSATELDPVAAVVLAPNPSPMTLDGTNTYLLGAPGTGAVVVVDPGPLLAAHRRAVEDATAARDAEVAAVVVTHHHHDHAEAAVWAAEWGAALYAWDPARVPGTARRLSDGARLRLAGLTVEALHTPGHAADHLCLRVGETGAVLTGDHVLGRGTTVVAHPDGDMTAYMASLRRLLRTPAAVLYPGHGPPLRDPAGVVTAYLRHREERERQVAAAVAAGADTPAAIVARLYADVDPRLHPAAERSVRAHLAKLEAEGTVARDGDRVRTPGATPTA